MNIIVTGGGGFIGKALVFKLLEEGHSVTSISRSFYPELKDAGARVVKADLLDISALEKAFADQEIVFHVAAKAGYWGPYRDYHNSNVLGTLNVIDACINTGVGHLVYTSSASVVFDGNSIEGLNEEIPYPRSPLSHYTATKALAEAAVLKANGQGLKTLSIRPHLVLGPGDRHILPRVIEQARAGKLRIIGDGKNLVDITYIDNAVSAHMCALEKLQNNEPWGRAYFITNGEPVNLWDFVNKLLPIYGLDPLTRSISATKALKIAGILGITHKLFAKSVPPRLSKFLVHELSSSHWFDISAARKHLGYIPQISTEEGLQRLLNKA